MTKTTTVPSRSMVYRKPDKEDGAKVWMLLNEAGNLDVNSAYHYVLLCDKFRDTCMLAERNGNITGFVSGFLVPGCADTLFVWQIAVDAAFRGQGVARNLLEKLVFAAGHAVRVIEATVCPSNESSHKLFAGFAAEYGARLTVQEGYPARLFPPRLNHEEEQLLRIEIMNDRGSET